MKAVLPHAPTQRQEQQGRAVPRATIAKLLATRQVGNELAVPEKSFVEAGRVQR